jgi:hypothetical protein
MATHLERLIDRVGEGTLTTAVSVAIERIAEEIAKDALNDEEFRQDLRTMVRARSRAIVDRLLREQASSASEEG